MTDSVLGIIGGSGTYDLPGLNEGEWRTIDSPWGEPSDQVLFAQLEGLPVRFLPRHGRGHRLSPTGINYRANIDVLKRAGVTDILSICAVGSLREELEPGHLVLVDQFVDRTWARQTSFFGNGCVAHVPMGQPVSGHLVDLIHEAARAHKISCHKGGTLVVIEGPQFSTRAESELHRFQGSHVIGMTALPEAKLAREAELPFATVAIVTDYDSWHSEHEAVEVAEIMAMLAANKASAQKLLVEVAKRFPRSMGSDPARTALEDAIMTAVDARDPALLAKLDAVAGRVL